MLIDASNFGSAQDKVSGHTGMEDTASKSTGLNQAIEPIVETALEPSSTQSTHFSNV